MSRIQHKLEKFQKALDTLDDIYTKPSAEDRVYIDATIRRFGFTFELTWKFLKEYFYQQGVDLNYPKEILQQAFTSKLIDDEKIWLQMLHDRNMTSHSYDQELADKIYHHIKEYVPELKKLLDKVVK